MDKLKSEIVKVVQLMYQKNYIVASDGNVSALIDENSILTTPSGIVKGFITVDDLVVVNRQGEKIAGPAHLRPSSELKMHLKVYDMRKDVRAIVHAHPPITTAFSVADIRLNEIILPEVIFTLGMIKFTEYATPTTEAVPLAIDEAIRDNDVIVLTRHGSLTVGKNLMDAYAKLESLEHTSKIISEAMRLASAHGTISPLAQEEVLKLRAIKESMSSDKQPEQEKSIELNDHTIAYIIEEVLKRFRE
ncbi:MAG: class II aldolase/adducin family protein [Oligoflexia bacterium]|nr:class II aldolase/adducin family protein [Oligoflexia bacterium]